MTQYAAPFGIERLRASMRELQAAVRKLQTRTAGIDSGLPLMMLPGVIDSGYTSGDPQVLVNGATTLSGPFEYLTSYTPAANDSVLLAPCGALGSYVVLGKLSG